MQKRLVAFLAFVATIVSPPLSVTAAPILDIRGGELFGASNVDVLGDLYNVSFLDGTFNSLFGSTSFIFETQTEALAASEALMNHVFLDFTDPLQFDTNPAATNGITSSTHAFMYTPYRIPPLTPGNTHTPLVYFFNHQIHLHDQVGPLPPAALGFVKTGTFHGFPAETWAVWTPDVSLTVVPEPSTIILLGAGLAGLVVYRKKRK